MSLEITATPREQVQTNDGKILNRKDQEKINDESFKNPDDQ